MTGCTRIFFSLRDNDFFEVNRSPRMSRTRKFSHSLASGYLFLGATTVQTLASVPLALHYLPKQEIGLWALVIQISGYLLLIDLGMSGSISRILIDHKDQPGAGVYGAIIKTGALVLLVQGAIIVIAGVAVSFCLPDLFAVPTAYQRDFQILTAGQCIALGALFVGRMFNHILQAHQRYDLCNYALMFGVAANLGVMWFGFHLGWDLYSLLAASVAGQLVATVLTLAAVIKLKLFPQSGAWGCVNRKTFHELFSYGREILLLSVGLQLVSASQIMVISRTLGLDAAAVWYMATKSFMLAQQIVYRPVDFSAAAFSEMMARGERDRLLTRFRDLVVISASFAVWAGLAAGLCNQSFLAIWTQGAIHWRASSDWLMALFIVVTSITRSHIAFTGLTKDIRAMKYVYPFEGIAFVGLSLLVTPVWGMNGVIVSALVTNILCSGIYGFWRTREYFHVSHARSLFGWLRQPLWFLLALSAVFMPLWWISRDWNPFMRLSVNATVAAVVGFGLFWQLGLSRPLRVEILALLTRKR
jgi:O-antigen/teichoic acid export membrane protein